MNTVAISVLSFPAPVYRNMPPRPLDGLLTLDLLKLHPPSRPKSKLPKHVLQQVPKSPPLRPKVVSMVKNPNTAQPNVRSFVPKLVPKAEFLASCTPRPRPPLVKLMMRDMMPLPKCVRVVRPVLGYYIKAFFLMPKYFPNIKTTPITDLDDPWFEEA